MSWHDTTRRDFIRCMGLGAASMMMPKWLSAAKASKDSPNILFCISDDQSWLHTSISGTKAIKTPNFDRVAEEGVLFTNSFCACPSCTPSRSAVLTGQEIYRVEQGGVLFGALPRKFDVYPTMLEHSGYTTGATGKPWAPGNFRVGGWENNPAGAPCNDLKYESPKGISNIDYAANFESFLTSRDKKKPFCFWYGAYEPHRWYLKDAGLKSGKKLEDVEVPPCLPDSPEVRSDILDYFFEIEWQDRHLGKMIETLEKTGELDNTIIVVTSDNGMPFPRAKATLYDYGVRMPLAVRWGDRVKSGRTVDDFISHTDFAPTFLDAVGLPVPEDMTGRSFKNILLSEKSGRIDRTRDRIFTARERHTIWREGELGYPQRSIRTDEYLYVHNYEPDRWPAGDPELKLSDGVTRRYGDIDGNPTKSYMTEHRDDPEVGKLFELAFEKRPEEELYDVINDPGQLNNLAANSKFEEVRKKLRKQLDTYLSETKDPRSEGKSPWDKYPYYCGNPKGIVPYDDYLKSIKKKK